MKRNLVSFVILSLATIYAVDAFADKIFLNVSPPSCKAYFKRSGGVTEPSSSNFSLRDSDSFSQIRQFTQRTTCTFSVRSQVAGQTKSISQTLTVVPTGQERSWADLKEHQLRITFNDGDSRCWTPKEVIALLQRGGGAMPKVEQRSMSVASRCG